MLKDFIRRLLKFILRLLGLDDDDKPARPSTATNVEVNIVASNVVLTWTPPTTRDDGAPLPVSEIAEQIISVRNVALPDFTEVARVAGTVSQAPFPNTPGGTWMWRVVVVDTDSQSSAPADSNELTIPVSAPSPATGVTAAIVE